MVMSTELTSEFLPANADSDTPRISGRIASALAGRWRIVPILVALAIIWAFFGAQSPIFLSSRNLTNLANQISVSTFLALGLVFLVLVQQIDISLAAVAAMAGGTAAVLNTEAHWNVVISVVVALAVGVGAGVIQGTIVTLIGVPAFIVTLGGMFIFEAVLFWELPVTQVVPLANTPLQDISFTNVPAWLSYVLGAIAVGFFGSLRWADHRSRLRNGLASHLIGGTIAPTAAVAVLVFGILIFVFNAYTGVPVPAVIIVSLCIILSYVSGHTPLGKHIYAIGGNPEAARRAGIRVKLVTVFIFGLAGFLSAAAGIVQASQLLGVSEAAADLTLLLGALAAVVVGGISLYGGRGSVWAAVIGGILIGSIQNGLDLINSSTAVQWSVEGAVLIAAVVIDALISRSSTRRVGAR
jgi:D-xylose transport system permease protein